MDGKLLTLKHSGVANGFSKAQLRALARLADLVELSPRQALTRAGTRRTGCYLLLSGCVVTETCDTVWLTSQAGTFVGLAETLAGSGASADTVALTTVRALVFTPGAIRAALRALDALCHAALTQLATESLDRRRGASQVAWVPAKARGAGTGRPQPGP